MTLRKRLARLEARKAPAAVSDGPDVLTAMLSRLEAAVVASGDAFDRPDAPLIERAVRRYLRGEADPADALRVLVAVRPAYQRAKGIYLGGYASAA